MSKIFQVARREFLATVLTKGFIIGVLITPAMLGLMALILPGMVNNEPPKIDGELALVDPTGQLEEDIREYLRPEKIAERTGRFKRAIKEQGGLDEVGGTAGAMVELGLQAVLTNVAEIRLTSLPPSTTDVEAEKARLREGTLQDGGRLAVAVIRPEALEPEPKGEREGAYELFVRTGLGDRLEDEIQDALRYAISEARIRAAGLEAEQIRGLTRVKRVRSVTVTKRAEHQTNEVFNILLPAAFLMLLLVSVLTSGQSLMTTMIEEKSSRVVEVLLSAVSPMQLMTGKIVGQLCVGFAILAIYAGIGLVGLISAERLGLLDLSLLLYLPIFYVIAYFIVGSLMGAIGAAVNEVREAQTLMMPIMMIMMIPWLLWIGIARDPNSVFATVMSFVPPVNTFVIMLRMTTNTPPPTWQVWLSIAVGVASVYAALWFAAKVFRVGLLMFGKAPNFATLIRWVRMA